MRAPSLAAALAALGLFAAAPASAQDYFGRTETDNVSFRIDKERTSEQKILIGSLLGGAVLFGGVGLLFTLDSDSKSNEVSAVGMHTGRVYTPELEQTRKDALRSRNFAIGSYAVGGALLVATGIAFIATHPGTEELNMEEYQRRHDEERREESSSRTLITPVRGGALVGRSWLF